MKFEIKSLRDRSIIFSGKFDSWRDCVEAARGRVSLICVDLSNIDLSGITLRNTVLHGADLHNTNLRGSDLSGSNFNNADLRAANLSATDLTDASFLGANLHGADMSGARLTDANLGDTDLRYVNFRGSSLRCANLQRADLRRADFSSANIRCADFTDAVMHGVDLRNADLRNATLTPIRDDFWASLSSAPAEVPALIRAIKGSYYNGLQYQTECAALAAILAILPNGSRPAAAFCAAIKPGDTIENSSTAQLAVEWAEDWLKRMREAFAGNESEGKS